MDSGDPVDDRRLLQEVATGDEDYSAGPTAPNGTSSCQGEPIRVSKNEAFDRFILWNIMYDGVLAVELPEGASIVGFADDLAILAAGTTPEYAAAIAEEAVAGAGEDGAADDLQ